VPALHSKAAIPLQTLEVAESATRGALVRFFAYVGGLWLLLLDTVRYGVAMKFRPSEVVKQAYFLGVESWLIVALTAIFTGMVISLETVVQAVNYGLQDFIGGSVAFGTVRELGPMLAGGIIFAGRGGAAITAEIGSMVVTEQVEALEAMGVSPVKALVVPRVLASIIMVPALTIFADIIGTYGGYFMAWIRVNLPPYVYWHSVQNMVDMSDFWKGLLKAAFFGLLVALVACYEGLHTEGGAEGVGRATTRAVVISIILVFGFNFVLSYVLFG
jgi:phospholipid/cholesterol/gamma-HCH transport system permease protein